MTTLSSLFSDIAEAIRGKDGTSEPIVASTFPDRIEAIPTGGSGGGDLPEGWDMLTVHPVNEEGESLGNDLVIPFAKAVDGVAIVEIPKLGELYPQRSIVYVEHTEASPERTVVFSTWRYESVFVHNALNPALDIKISAEGPIEMDWGDGTISEVNSSGRTAHEYAGFREGETLKLIIRSLDQTGRWTIGSLSTNVGFFGETRKNHIYSFDLGGNCESVGRATFTSVKGLQRANLGASCTVVGRYAFKDDDECGCLEQIEGASITTFQDDSQFNFQKNLTKAEFPNLTAVPSTAFSECISLIEASYPLAESIGSDAFRGTAIVEADFPVCTSVGQNAFYYCKSLATVSLPLVSSVANTAFRDDTSLTSVVLGSQGHPVQSIGYNAFQSCTQAGLEITVYTANGTADDIARSPWGATAAQVTFLQA